MPTIRTRSFTIDRAAYLKAMWTRGLGRRILVLSAVLLVVVAILGLIGGKWVALGGAIGGFGVLPLTIPIRYLYSRYYTYTPSSKQAYDDPRTMEFSDAGVHTTTEGGAESNLPWTHFDHAERRGDFTLLFIGKIQHMMVVDSAFSSSEDRAALLAMLRAKGLLKDKG